MSVRQLYAIIAGVGPGAGAAIARKFAETYAVVLLARNPSSYQPVLQEISQQGGKAIGVEGDITKRETVENALKAADENFGGQSRCMAAIFNASARPAWKSFLELSQEEFVAPFETSCIGGFQFAQVLIPKLLDSTDSTSSNAPSLIFTGATASLRGSKMLSPFAVAKTATRTMAQSLAKEFGPQGLHISHVIIDGVIDIPGGKVPEGVKGKIDPQTIANTYWYLHTQPPSGFTHELEIRPATENW